MTFNSVEHYTTYKIGDIRKFETEIVTGFEKNGKLITTDPCTAKVVALGKEKATFISVTWEKI